jgi:uncharacterized tellurite resistance protein B-like protein
MSFDAVWAGGIMIVAIFGALVGVIGLIIWRLNQAASVARDVAEAANEVSGLARRWSWMRKANRHPLDGISDPREAATAMMVAIAQYDGAISERERLAIIDCVSETFGSTAEQAEEMLAQARFMVKDVVDPSSCFSRLAPLVEKQLGPAERRELIEMLMRVANADSSDNAAVITSIANFKRRLLG